MELTLINSLLRLLKNKKTADNISMKTHFGKITSIISIFLFFTAALFADITYKVEKGDTLLKTDNVEHGCVCLEEGILLDIFTPYREDFVND